MGLAVSEFRNKPISHVPFWSEPVSMFGPFWLTAFTTSYFVDLAAQPAPNPRCSEFPRRLATTVGALGGEDPVSRQLHTAPSPAPQVPVGYLG